MLQFVNEVCCDSIYSFADAVNSLYYVKTDSIHQQPTGDNVHRFVEAIQKSLVYLAICLNTIKQNAINEESADVVGSMEKANSLIRSAYYDLMSESVGKRVPLSFHAYIRNMYARQKHFQSLIRMLEIEIGSGPSTNDLTDAYIRALDLFISTVTDRPSSMDGLGNCWW